MINISGLNVRYGKKRALDRLNLQINKGECLFLAGANGSGKTTLLRTICGVLFPDGGEIQIDGMPVGHKTKKRTAYIPASISCYHSLSLKEAIQLHRFFFPGFVYRGIGEFPIDHRRKVASLSKGEKTLFFLSLALSSNPEYLLIDDVIHFLDPHLRELFLKSILGLIGERNLSVVVAAQSSIEIEGIFQRVVLLNRGRVVVDETVEDLKKKLVRVYTDSIPDHLPVIFSRSWENTHEVYLYPYESGMELSENIEYLRLSEILRAFIGGEYDWH